MDSPSCGSPHKAFVVSVAITIVGVLGVIYSTVRVFEHTSDWWLLPAIVSGIAGLIGINSLVGDRREKYVPKKVAPFGGPKDAYYKKLDRQLHRAEQHPELLASISRILAAYDDYNAYTPLHQDAALLISTFASCTDSSDLVPTLRQDLGWHGVDCETVDSDAERIWDTWQEYKSRHSIADLEESADDV